MTRTALAVCLALTFPAISAAASRATARKEVREDQQQLQDDLRDAKQAQQLLKAFDRAAAAGNRKALAGVEARVEQALEREAREAKLETGEAAHDVHQDAPRQGWRPSSGQVDDTGQRLADDRHRVVDRRDLILEADYRNKIVNIRDEWQSLRGHRQRKHMARKHALLQEVVRLSRLEIGRDVNELHEDRERLKEENHD